MTRLNPSFSHLNNPYIFAIIDRKLNELKKKIEAKWINLSIGDIALPLAPCIVKAIAQAVEEMGTIEGMKGYPPTYGFDFLRSRIAKTEYANLNICEQDIYISDGINSDALNIQDLFHPESAVGIPSPTYPAYFKAAIMAGKKKNVCPLPCLAERDFQPVPPELPCDFIYLCTPNNPTGQALTKKDLTHWVEWALKYRAILLIDSAYSSFISSGDVPKSIYEIPGAYECAVEFKSFSKSAGFTGLRCAYAVIPKTVFIRQGKQKYPLQTVWQKRLDIAFNGVAYPIQRGAEAALSEEGQAQTQSQVRFYLSLAQKLKKGLEQSGHTCWGGVNSPYIWWKIPKGFTSWQFFDHLLSKCQIISVPGVGFGSLGENYIRLSAFSTEENISLALEKIQKGI